MVGFFTPAAYGVTDSFQVMIHPINWALLSPNVAFRYQVINTRWVDLSLTAEGGATILQSGGGPAEQDGRPLAHLLAGMVSTFEMGAGSMLSLNASYQRDFYPDDDALVWSVSLNWLIDTAHLIVTTGGAQYSFGAGELVLPYASLMYAYSWDILRIGVGAAMGNAFPIVRVNGNVDRDLRIWPVIDVWARF
jgi:hypothetical protein